VRPSRKQLLDQGGRQEAWRHGYISKRDSFRQGSVLHAPGGKSHGSQSRNLQTKMSYLVLPTIRCFCDNRVQNRMASTATLSDV
jgi:hypothetical protein